MENKEDNDISTFHLYDCHKVNIKKMCAYKISSKIIQLNVKEINIYALK